MGRLLRVILISLFLCQPVQAAERAFIIDEERYLAEMDRWLAWLHVLAPGNRQEGESDEDFVARKGSFGGYESLKDSGFRMERWE